MVVCRCSPTQKADIVKLLKVHTGKPTCAIGDGGNDVSMIQAANAGIGIVGKVRLINKINIAVCELTYFMNKSSLCTLKDAEHLSSSHAKS